MDNRAIRQTRQIELLKKYFPIDEENKIVTIKIHYDKATDLLDFSVGELKCELFNNEVLERITEVTDKIPTDYHADVIFVVEDYCDYDPALLLEKLRDCIEINNFTIIRERKRNWVISAILILIGFILLFSLGICREYALLGDGLRKEVLEEMLDITSWVFIWQAVTIMFLTPSELVKTSTKLIMKLNTISFFDSNGKELVRDSKSNVMADWDLESKASNLKKSALLIVSTIITALGISDIANTGVLFFGESIDVQAVVFSIVGTALVLVTGITGLYAYNGSKKAKKIMFPIAIVLLLFAIFTIIGICIVGEFSYLMRSSLTLIITLAYGIIGVSERHNYKKEK